MVTWSPEQYLKYAAQRNWGSQDLAAKIPLKNPKEVVDLGCGPGNSTAVLREHYRKAHILGTDLSADMIARAKKDHPDIDFAVADAAAWAPEKPVDLIFSNAVFQWLPDHHVLLPRLFGFLNPGGVLAFQVPDNWSAACHQGIFNVASQQPWADKLKNVSHVFHPHDVGAYYDILSALTPDVQIWQTTYQYVFDDAAGIVDFYKGTALLPYLQKLTDDEKSEFLAHYLTEMQKSFLPRNNGHVLMPFTRIFAIATRAKTS